MATPQVVSANQAETVTSPYDEKNLADNHDDDLKSESSEDDTITDLFSSFPPVKGIEHEPSPLTFRAVIVGICLGSLVNASNVYLGLKTGFTFPSSMFGAIFGYGIVKLLSTTLSHVPILGNGGKFGPQENSIIQASAAGAGGLSGLFVAGLPAMYRLELLSDDPKKDFARVLTITFVCAFFGLFAAVPLRKFFIINVARELKLVFPSATATAVTIRSMHAVGSGANDAVKKIKALGYTFLGAMIQNVAGQYADGICRNWHIFTWFFIWSGKTNWAMNIQNWGWYIQLTPAFFGSGMLVGLNAALSWWLGTVFAWGFAGPLLVHTGECIGKQTGNPESPWKDRVNFGSMTGMDKPGYVPSPRYWFLWPGVMVLLVYSLAEFFFHFKVIYEGAKYGLRETAKSLNGILQKRGKSNAFLEKQAAKVDEGDFVEDFAPANQQVPVWVWATGTTVFVAMGMIVVALQFDMNPGMAILACILGLLFAFLSIYGGAVTDCAPLTASAKASQLVFGGVTHGQEIKHAQRVNLIAGNIASGTADVSYTLVSDFRVGFLLKTPPNLQFYAQAVGAFISVFLAPGIFVLFMAAYPCVWNTEVIADPDFVCPFQAPSVAAWEAVAKAVTMPSIPIPSSSGYFSIAMGIFCVLQIIFKNFYLVGSREKYREWLPNWMSIGVAWVLGPDSGYANAILFGSITAWWWQKYFPKNWDMYGYAVAAGLIAGEGLGGVINAALELGKVSGSYYGTSIGLPTNGFSS